MICPLWSVGAWACGIEGFTCGKLVKECGCDSVRVSRPTFCRLSSSHLIHNVRTLVAKAPQAKIIAMVKANAYGHGIRSVSRLISPLVNMLGVASLDEASMIRSLGIDTPIMLAEGVFSPLEWAKAAGWNCHVVLHHASQWEWLQQVGSTLPCPVAVWIKVNTGMNRLGFFPSDVAPLYEILRQHPSVNPSIGLMTHYASGELGPHHPMCQQQRRCFQELKASLTQFTGPVTVSNSGAVLTNDHVDEDYVRLGFAMYGLSPVSHTVGRDWGLKPVMTLGSGLISTYTVSKGQSIGYNSTYTCPQATPIGIAAIGYGDGYPWTAPSGTPVMVNGVRCALVGRVSMDMMAIDLRASPHARVGDELVVWGDDLPCEELSTYVKVSPYALCTGLHHRVRCTWDTPTSHPM